jgi:hypothetical protein
MLLRFVFGVIPKSKKAPKEQFAFEGFLLVPCLKKTAWLSNC